MLAHASGLQREPVGRIWENLEAPDQERLLRELEDAEQVLPVHFAFHYSNLAFALLGQIVELSEARPWGGCRRAAHSEAAGDEEHRSGSRRDDGWARAYGLGYDLQRIGERVLAGHGGAMPGFLAGLRVRRQDRVGAPAARSRGCTSPPTPSPERPRLSPTCSTERFAICPRSAC